MKNGKINSKDKDNLIKEFCNIVKIDLETFKGSSRSSKLPFLRYIFCYCIRKEFNQMTLSDIGGIFGKKHSNTYTGIQKVKLAIEPPRPDHETLMIINSFLPFCKQYKQQIQIPTKKELFLQSISRKCHSLSVYFAQLQKKIENQSCQKV